MAWGGCLGRMKRTAIDISGILKKHCWMKFDIIFKTRPSSNTKLKQSLSQGISLSLLLVFFLCSRFDWAASWVRKYQISINVKHLTTRKLKLFSQFIRQNSVSTAKWICTKFTVSGKYSIKTYNERCAHIIYQRKLTNLVKRKSLMRLSPKIISPVSAGIGASEKPDGVMHPIVKYFWCLMSDAKEPETNTKQK